MTPVDCSLGAQAKILLQYPALFENGFYAGNSRPQTKPEIMEKLCAWIIANPPHKAESSYRYKHRAEGQWFDRNGVAYDGPDADVGYVSQGQMILAAIMCGYTPAIYGQGCEFKMEKTK
jgi:hypothetical protein